MARLPKAAKMVTNPQLRDHVQDRLSGVIHRPNGTIGTGPVVPEWKDRNKPHRQDWRWSTDWSPEQISNRLLVDLPGG